MPGCIGGGLNDATASAVVCDGPGVWQWHWHNVTFVLQGSQSDQSNQTSNPSIMCLGYGRGLGSHVSLQSCNGNLTQQWLPLPRGGAEPNALLDQLQFPLHTEGRRIVDAAGRLVRLRGVNWYGAHMEQRVNNGLDRVPLGHISRMIQHLGFNSVRLNVAVQMWFDAQPVDAAFVAANPQLLNKTPLEVFDECVSSLTNEGLLVIINSHVSDYSWCCSLSDEQGLWYNDRWTVQHWLESLGGMAARYKDNSRVIGFDLRNEVRGIYKTDANQIPTILDLAWWNPESLGLRGVIKDWRKAALTATTAVWQGNPHSLVIVEGIGAIDLVATSNFPLTFGQSCLTNRTLWSVHDYAWSSSQRLAVARHAGVGFQNADLIKLFSAIESLVAGGDDPSLQDYSLWASSRSASWGFLLDEDRAPVWVGEFGDGSITAWWNFFVRYAREMDLDWSYWTIDGIKYPSNVTRSGETAPTVGESDESFGILARDYTSVGSAGVRKLVDLTSLMAPVLGELSPNSGSQASFEQNCNYTLDCRTWSCFGAEGKNAGPVVAEINSLCCPHGLSSGLARINIFWVLSPLFLFHGQL